MREQRAIMAWTVQGDLPQGGLMHACNLPVWEFTIKMSALMQVCKHSLLASWPRLPTPHPFILLVGLKLASAGKSLPQQASDPVQTLA